MKIFLALMKFDYGVEERGYSYEYYNVYLPLCDVYGQENVILFDYFSEFKKNGKAAMNAKVEQIVASERPDISVFCILWEGQFDENTVSRLRDKTKTVIYFFDDPWRQKFVRHWIKYFDFFTTSDFYMLKQYRSEGIDNVIYTPFGFNSSLYKKLDIEKKHDVSFVGGYSPLRRWIVNLLEKEGIKVSVFGRGWGSEGRWISQEEMVEIFNSSRINLNLSNAVYNDIRFLLWSLGSLKNIKQLILLKKTKEQVKGRHFEINGCGGFQLSYFIPGLNTFYEIDKEIAVYEDIKSLPGEIKFFLKNESFREQIADSGYRRSAAEHTSQSYLKRMIENAVNNNSATDS